MAVAERLREAVLTVVPVCVPNAYDGAEQVYCTFSIDDYPEMEGDNSPSLMRHTVQLHLHCPPSGTYDPRPAKRGLCRAIFAAGFTYPQVVDAGDLEYGHLVFEFEDVDGDL